MSTTTALITKSSVPWCATSPPHPSIVVFYWLILCLWILNIVISVLGTYKILHTKRDTSRLFKVLWIIIALFFCLSPPGFAFGFQSGWECWFGFVGWELLTMMGVDAYQYGLAVLNVFFIMRLKTVFADILSLKYITLIVLYICVCIQFVSPIISTYYFMKGWNPYVRKWGLRYFTIFTYTNIISSTIVLTLFVRKILLLPTLREDSNVHKRGLLNLATKYIVCCTFAAISTFIVATFGIVRSTVIPSHIFARGLHIFCLMMDSSVNLFCLYLQFPFGLRIYEKLCGKMHSCFRQCFMRLFHINDNAAIHMNHLSVPGKSVTLDVSSSKVSSANSGNSGHSGTE